MRPEARSWKTAPVTSPAATSVHDPTEERAGLALAVIITGVLVAAIDTTIVVLALPDIQRALHAGLASLTWVIIGYLLVITLLAIQVGRLGDMYGRVRMYQAGFAVFVVGSLLCALSWDVTSMVVFRILQGVGGALLTANSGAVIADTVPPRTRGRAFGLLAVGWNLGAILGILLGGLITTYISWRWIFGINVPIGTVAFLVGLRVLHDRSPRAARRLDVAGALLVGLGLLGILWAMVELATAPFDGRIAAAIAGGAVLLVVFVVVERRTAEPMVDLALLRVRTMTPSLLASMLQALGTFAVLFLLTMYLQGVRGLSPIAASGLLVPGYLVGALAAPLGGRLADRVGPVLPATIGIGASIVALIGYAALGPRTTLVLVVAASIVNGLGSGLFYPANTSAVMTVAGPKAFGVGSGLLRTFSNTGMVFSFSVALLVASRTIPRQVAFAIFVGTTKLTHRAGVQFTNGLRAAFLVSIGLLVAAMALSAYRVVHRRQSPLSPGYAHGEVPADPVLPG